MEQTSKQKIFLSLPFWWLGLTTIYLPLSSSYIYGSSLAWMDSSSSSVISPVMSRFALFIGLFVPIGFFSFDRGKGPTGMSLGLPANFIVFPFVIFVVFGGEYFLRKMNLSPLKKFFLVILILFLLTMAVDFMIWGRWESGNF